ncbi:solute carrier family 15 member 4-like [Argonauta hians]
MSESDPLLFRDRGSDPRLYSDKLNHPPSVIISDDNHISRWKTKTSCAAILIVEACERIAFYSLLGNLVLFLNEKPLLWNAYNASSLSFYFLGLSFITALLGGLIADTLLGRFKGLLLSFLIYILGYFFLLFVSSPFRNDGQPDLFYSFCSNWTHNSSAEHIPEIFQENCAIPIFFILTLTAFGIGSFKANIIPFGADQVQDNSPANIRSFFNWFYLSLNFGAFIGLGLLTFIQQYFTFFYGFAAALGALGLGFFVFLAGRCCYKVSPPNGSVLINIYQIINNAFVNRRKCRQKKINFKSSDSQLDQIEDVMHKKSFLDFSKVRYGGRFHDSLVNDVKALGKVFIFFLALIPYWVVYFQMETTFLVQGLHMRLSMNNGSESTLENPDYNCTSVSEVNYPKIAVAWLSLCDVLLIFFFLPLMEKVIYPWLDSVGYTFSLTQRITTGMVFAVFAMVAAGVVEYFRLQTIYNDPEDQCKCNIIVQAIGTLGAHDKFYAADMSIFYQVPQYAFLGISEVFASVAGLEFAYSMAPPSMKGIIMGLFLFFSGIGSLVSIGVIQGLKGTLFYGEDFGDINIRKCDSEGHVTHANHLDYYFFSMAVFLACFTVVFVIISRCCNFSKAYPVSKTKRDSKKRNRENRISINNSD